ncbi:uncharacterized protein BDW43DRAFT_9296 [Aspergillus alliaceus]|uniref:uncharacterized protein n=1 Tax=Petromyces alliaceus TaxID=209559 RepID=UPI0012A63969|nr:uncharacterized protein BDW43DRAFT_9296 [Aspergillus alliaceus]KAB8239638.1 hypothetical protein BDW43DRAFT_9296 [Aspergillus alliaceus]
MEKRTACIRERFTLFIPMSWRRRLPQFIYSHCLLAACHLSSNEHEVVVLNNESQTRHSRGISIVSDRYNKPIKGIDWVIKALNHSTKYCCSVVVKV